MSLAVRAAHGPLLLLTGGLTGRHRRHAGFVPAGVQRGAAALEAPRPGLRAARGAARRPLAVRPTGVAGAITGQITRSAALTTLSSARAILWPAAEVIRRAALLEGLRFAQRALTDAVEIEDQHPGPRPTALREHRDELVPAQALRRAPGRVARGRWARPRRDERDGRDGRDERLPPAGAGRREGGERGHGANPRGQARAHAMIPPHMERR